MKKEITKKKQMEIPELKRTRTEIKNLLQELNSRSGLAEIIHEFEDKSTDYAIWKKRKKREWTKMNSLR